MRATSFRPQGSERLPRMCPSAMYELNIGGCVYSCDVHRIRPKRKERREASKEVGSNESPATEEDEFAQGRQLCIEGLSSGPVGICRYGSFPTADYKVPPVTFSFGLK